MEDYSLATVLPAQSTGAAGGAGETRRLQAAQQAASAQAATQAAGETTTTATDDASYTAIVAKVNGGTQLTSAELDVLKTRSPALYARALQATQARQGLRERLEEDPAHAGQTARAAIAEATRATAGEDEEQRAAVARALNDEYRRFTSQYDQIDLSAEGRSAAALE